MEVARRLQAMRVRVHPLFSVSRVADQELHTERGQHLPVDEALWCIEGSAPGWPSRCGLACDAAGLVRGNRHLQSESPPFVVAAGDIATLSGQPLPQAGVSALRAPAALNRESVRE